MHSEPKCSFIYIYIMKPHRRIWELWVEHTRTHLKNSPSLARLLYPFSSRSHSEPIPAKPECQRNPPKSLKHQDDTLYKCIQNTNRHSSTLWPASYNAQIHHTTAHIQIGRLRFCDGSRKDGRQRWLQWLQCMGDMRASPINSFVYATL